jgi:hypothetical protein
MSGGNRGVALLVAVSMLALLAGIACIPYILAAAQQKTFVLDPDAPSFVYEKYELNDSATTKEFDFTIAAPNQTYWLSLPKNSTVTGISMNLTGKITTIYKMDITPAGLAGLSVGNLTYHMGNEVVAGRKDTTTFTAPSLFLADGINGTIISTYSLSNLYYGTYSTFIGNVTSDPGNEIVFGNKDKKVHVLNVDDSGQLTPAWEYETNGSVNSVTVADIEEDGINEVIAGSEDKSVYAFNASGGIKWIYTTDSAVYSIAVGNLTSASGKEIAVGSGSKIFILNSTGGEVFNKSMGGNLINAIAVGNVTDDPNDEIATGDNGNIVFLLNVNETDASVAWNYSAKAQINSVTIGEAVEDSPGNEVIAGSDEPKVYTISNNGTLIWDFTTDTNVQTVTIGNMTTDEGNEVAAGDGHLYSFNFNYFPTNLSIDAAGDGDYDWSYSGKMRTRVTASGFASDLNSYLSSPNCTADANGNCNVPLIFHSDWPSKLNISAINVTYTYNTSSIVRYQNVSAWSRTDSIRVNESVGNLSKNISFISNPSENVLVSYVRIANGATTPCDFNGTAKTVAAAEGKNTCNVDDFTIPSSGGLPSPALLWDNTMSTGVPVMLTEQATYYTNATDNFYYRKPFAIYNTTGTTITNVIANISVSHSSVKGLDFLNVTWGSATCNITPPAADANCDTGSPTYTARSCGSGVFQVCKKDTDSNGIIDFFRWIQPYSNSSVSYNAGGTTNLAPSLTGNSVTPSSGLWGADFNYSVFVNDTDNDQVNVTLWVYFNLTGAWSRMGEKNITGTGVVWFNLSSNMSWVNLDRYRFEYRDYNSSGYLLHSPSNTSEFSGPDVQRHSASLVYIAGNNSEVVRPGSNSVLLAVGVNDTTTGSWSPAGAGCRFYVTTNGTFYDGELYNTTNSSGACLYHFDPNATYGIGNQTWEARISGDPYYNSTNSSNFTMVIRGELNIQLSYPQAGQGLQRNYPNSLQAMIADENGQPVNISGYNCTFWFNGTGIANTTTSGSVCSYSWNPGCSAQTGNFYVNVTLWGNVSNLYGIVDNESNAMIVMKDMLNTTIANPQPYYQARRGESISLNSSVNDTCLFCVQSDYNVTWYKKWSRVLSITINETSGLTLGREPFVINGTRLSMENIDLGDWRINRTRVVLDGQEIPSDVLAWTNGTRTEINNSQAYFSNSTELAFLLDLQPYQGRTFLVYYNDTAQNDYNISYIPNGGFEGNATAPWQCGQDLCSGGSASCCACEARSLRSAYGNFSLYLSNSNPGDFPGSLVWAYQHLAMPMRSEYVKIRYNATGEFDSESYVNVTIGSLTYTLNTSSGVKNTWVERLLHNESFYTATDINISVHDKGAGGCPGASAIHIEYVCIANSSGNCTSLDSGAADSYVLGSQDLIGSGYSRSWSIPANETTGLRRIVANSTGTYHEPSAGVVPVGVFGWANLSSINITSDFCWYNQSYTCMRNATVSIHCLVYDVNLSVPIKFYNVSFFLDNGYIGSNQTNSSGISMLTVDDITDAVGNHSIKCNMTDDIYYNDTSQNWDNLSMVITSGATTANLSMTPRTENAENITMETNHTFNLNVILSNTGGGIMYSPQLGISLPAGIYVPNISCGVISPVSSCSRTVSVNVTALASLGNQTINITATWSNADSTTGNTSNSSIVNVSNNAFLRIQQTYMNYTLQRGDAVAAGSFVLESFGNTGLTGVTLFESGGDSAIMDTWVSYSNSSFNLSRGQNKTIAVNVSVPVGVAEGSYWTYMYANATGSSCQPDTECYDSVLLNITVEPPDWEITPMNLTKNIGVEGGNRTMGTITVQNDINQTFSFNVSVLGNASSYVNVNMTQFNLSGYGSVQLVVYHNTTSGMYTIGNWTGNIAITNSNSSVFPVSLNASLKLAVVNLVANITYPSGSSQAGPVNASHIVNITVNATLNSEPIMGSMTWNITIGGQDCADAGQYYNTSTYLWRLNCTAPEIPGNIINNTLVITGNYSIYPEIDIYDNEPNAVVYDDLTPPQFSSVNASSVQNGTSPYIPIYVNITDNTGVSSAWLKIAYPGTTTYLYSYTKTGNRYMFNFTNPNVVGDYDLTFYANDSKNQAGNTTGWFEAYLTMALSGTASFPAGANQSINFTYYRNGTDYMIHEFATGTANASYNLTIHRRMYDLKAQLFGQAVTFYNVNSTQTAKNQYNVSNPGNTTDPVRFDFFQNKTSPDISNIGLPNTAENILMAFVVNAPYLSFQRASVMFNYTNALPGWTGQESDLRLFVCSDWSYSQRTCTGSFQHFNENILPNITANTIEFNTTNFSAYAMAESCYPLTCGQAPPDTGGQQQTGGPSGGPSSPVCGNGICETGENEVNCPGDCKTTFPFTVKTGVREIRMHPGENATYPFVIANNLNKSIRPMILLEGLGRFLRIDKNILTIPSGKEANTDIYVFIPDGTETGTYEGTITVTAEEQTQIIPVKLIVTLPGKGAVSLNMNVLTKRVEPYSQLVFNIEMRNMGTIPQLNVTMDYLIKDIRTSEILLRENETMLLEESFTGIKKMELKNTLPLGEYMLEVWATFGDRSVKDSDSFEVTESFFNTPIGRWSPWIALAVALAVAAYFGRNKYVKWKTRKLRYIFPTNFKKIPQESDEAFWIGKVAESEAKAWFSPKDLMTHVLIAGATGSGKSVGASVIVEEALEKKIPVIVFDPTAQWTGFVKACEDDFILNHYEQFGMDRRSVKPYSGMIYEIVDPHVNIDIKKYMNPGEVSVFVMNRLKPGEYDIAVKDIIDDVFAVKWEESTKLKMIIVFDEVHRLLEKYGGTGGYIALERACREFRKWGIGVIMCSQVLTDFKEAIAGNVLTDVQLNTKSLEDIGRVKEKYGPEYAQRVSRQGIGVGMFQNPKYNDGKPYFVQFRPTYHNPHKISNEEMDMYKEFAAKLEEIERFIAKMKKQGRDTSDIELDLKLAKDKLKQGRFRMAKIYITSLEKYLK